MKFQPFAPARLSRRVFSQLWMLALQFVLGMLLNLMGGNVQGAAHAFYVIVLVAHILNAIGLVEGDIYIALKAPSRLAWWAAATVTATLGAGVITARTGNDGWSFAMALGFLASAWLNGLLYVRARVAERVAN